MTISNPAASTAATDLEAVAKRLLSVRQYQGDGKRAPHKPLLILYALGRLSQTGSSQVSWSEAEVELAKLLTQFGRPATSSPAGSAAYPFTRLRSDGFWTLSRDVPNDSLRALRAEPITGQLDPAVEQALSQHPELLHETAVRLTLQQFPESMQAEVLEAVGLDTAPVLLAPLAGEQQQVRKRRASWRHQILQAWDNACAFCGYDGMTGVGLVGIEAAHVRWFNFGGPDDPDNGLALCSLHHKLLDRGVVGFAEQDQLVVSQHFTTRSEVGRRVYDLHGHRLKPRPGTPLPRPRYISWHTDEVFLRPAVTS